MPRFVILLHVVSSGEKHWDLMLQQGDVLATWQVPLPPQQWGAEPINCTKIFDHRLKYLDYEGQLSENRGQVSRVEAGCYGRASFGSDCVEVTLDGQQLQGELTLIRVEDERWELTLIC